MKLFLSLKLSFILAHLNAVFHVFFAQCPGTVLTACQYSLSTSLCKKGKNFFFALWVSKKINL